MNTKITYVTSGADDGQRNFELEKSKTHVIVEILEYVPHAVISKAITKKATGNISVSSFDAGEVLKEKICPFDIYIQIIDGAAEIGIDDKNYNLKLGEGIMIPAHTSHRFNANERFKMISTLIKSGYEYYPWLLHDNQLKRRASICELCKHVQVECNASKTQNRVLCASKC